RPGRARRLLARQLGPRGPAGADPDRLAAPLGGPCRGGRGTAVVEALPAVAAEGLDHLALALPLDALRDEAGSERVPQPDDRAQQSLPRLVGVDRRREAAVDLDDVHRQALQVRQRAVARPEVVERDLD